MLLSQTTCNLVEQDLPDDVTLRDLGEYRLKDLGRPRHLFQLVISGIPADFPTLKTLDMYPNNLPVQHTPFIGRQQEVTTVCDLLRREDVRLLTLTGPGGTGKTRLALQVAAELCDVFADGVFFVNLAPISDPALVVSSIAETLGIREWTGQSLLERLREDLRQKQVLLLLDNFEQVASAAVHVMNLLDACPKLKIMVTSREVLHVRAEHEFPVPPLALPDPKHLPDLATLSHYAAVALFIQRAQAIQPDFQMTNANARAIAEICARVDGLPLAIELAAARIKLLPPQALLGRIDQRLAVLTSTSRDVPTRQQTLRNTIGWSYNLLNVQEQQLFRRLSIFVGACTIEAVEAVCAAPGDGNEAKQVLDEVASLIDKSLLQQTEQEGEEPRLMMLETIREFGLEVLAASGELETIQQAHADYYLRLAEEAEPALTGVQSTLWLERLEREYDNLRAVMRWLFEQEIASQNAEMAMRLGSALERFWAVRGYVNEGQTFQERALAVSKEVAMPLRAKMLIAAGRLSFNQGYTDRAEVLCGESLALYRELGDTHGIALSLYLLAGIARTRGNPAVARSLVEEALELWREVGEKERIVYSLLQLALLDSNQGEYSRAQGLLEESLVIHRERGNKSGIADSLFQLAQVLFFSQGDPVIVRALLEEGLGLYKELGDKAGIASSFGLLGQIALSQGNATTARLLAEESLALYKEIGEKQGTAESLCFLASMTAFQGDYAAAQALYEQSLVILKEADDKWDIAYNLEGLASVIVLQGDPVWAARLWGVAEALREAMGAPIPPVYRPAYERSVAAARKQLGEKAFAVAWAEGRAMTPEQALAVQGKAMIRTAMDTRLTSTPPVKSPTSPAGLTAREVEVLRLLATGLTDAQIAEQLVLSLHTVHAHLRTIYSKLGVTSRSAATRYAFEQKLV